MPVIRSKPGKWGGLLLGMFRLWLNPNSIKSSQITLNDMHGHMVFAAREKFGAEKVALTEKDIKAIYKADPAGVRLPGTAQTTIGQGMIAGAILRNVLRLSINAPEKASVEVAMRLVGADLAKAGMGHSRASMMKAWSNYRGLSHFFAACMHDPKALKTIPKLMGLRVSKAALAKSPDDKMPLTSKEIGGMLDDLPGFVAGFEKVAREIMPKFVATAERFRELGEIHYAPGQRVRQKPLLDKKMMWRIDRSVKLPPVKITFKRLTNAERAAITSRVKSKR